MRQNKRNFVKRKKRIIEPKTGNAIVVGDIHGELDGFREILLHAKLINKAGNWHGGKKTLIQLGDAIDRGPFSIEAYDYLAKLARQAKEAGGKTVRLAGNHELEILKGNYFLSTILYDDIITLRRRLFEDIRAGNILAAYCQQGYIFTHAGICGKLQEILKKEMSPSKPSCAGIADRINKIFVHAAAKGDFSHSIFNIGNTRGGLSAFGGIFWEDLDDLFLSENPLALKQVLGHTPIPKMIRSDCGRYIAVDIGIFDGYGGGRAYLKIKKGRTEPVHIRFARAGEN